MKYYSDALNKIFATVEECEQAEREHDRRVQEEKQKRDAERARKKALDDEREARKREVDEAVKHAQKLCMAYVKDYHTYDHISSSPFGTLTDILNW